jgi:hypothetical protein
MMLILRDDTQRRCAFGPANELPASKIALIVDHADP